VGLPPDRSELTITVGDFGEICVSGDVALSVTCNSKVYVSPAVKVFAATAHVSVAPPLAPVPLFAAHSVASALAPPLTEISHCQE